MNKRIAIVYDWIDKWGGVERLLLNLAEMFPNAEFYTSYVDFKKASWARNLSLRTSFMQSLPDFIKRSRVLSIPFYEYAFQSFNFETYDMVISVSSFLSKAIITKPQTKHICYLLTPTRFLWLYPEEYIKGLFGTLTASYVSDWREKDFIYAQRPDMLVSISETVGQRCLKYYHRDTEVIYPPFDDEYWHQFLEKGKPEKNKEFLLVSRLEPYKKVGLVAKTFNSMPDKKLLIIGSGSEEKEIKSNAGPNIRFLSHISDKELAYWYQTSKALIMPQDEDFGYVSLEAQFFGCPVIAYKNSGAIETVVEDETGIFFEEQTPESLSEALERFERLSYNLEYAIIRKGREHIRKFSKKRFESAFISLIKTI